MVKRILPYIGLLIFSTGCTALTQINNSVVSNKTTAAPASPGGMKFIDNISVSAANKNTSRNNSTKKTADIAAEYPAIESETYTNVSVIKARTAPSVMEYKYAQLLNVDYAFLKNLDLLSAVDEWYGTRYLYGGTTKSGIDCSAFAREIYADAFSINLPRTAREQYKICKIISATEMNTGDLVFFNTSGGVSHVGVYLQNNKFVHASTSNGVIISDLYEPYYIKRFLGAGRVDGVTQNSGGVLSAK